MSDYKIWEQAKAMFSQNSCIGVNNCIFVASKDTRALGMQAGLTGSLGLVGGAIAGSMASADGLNSIDYDALLINQTEKGFGFIPLKTQGINWTGDLAKMVALEDNFFFIGINNIEKITIKDLSFLNRKVKTLRIFLTNGQKVQLQAKVAEKVVPYQEQNFAQFMAKYM